MKVMDLRQALEVNDEGKDAASVGVSDKDRPVTPSAEHDSVLEQQTRTRRLFTTTQLFAYSLASMAVWENFCETIFFALYNGGPSTLVWSTIIALVGVTCQAASLGEMASILPIAGAQYHWTWHLAPQSLKKFAAYIQGWATWLGYVSGLASISSITVLLLQMVLQLNNPGLVFQGWHTSLMIMAVLVVHMFANMYCIKIIPWLETAAGILHVCLFVIFVVVMAVLGNRHDAEFVFLESSITSGWQSRPAVAWHIGMLTAVSSFVGFDGAIHMSEETQHAKTGVPRAMFWSIVVNGILAFIMVVVVLVSMGSIEGALSSSQPIVLILMQVTGSKAATTAMVVGLFVISNCATIGFVASVSRVSWAWARDGGLPSYFAYIDSKHRVPVRAIILCVFIVCLLSLLNIGSAGYVVFGAITSLGSFAICLSYLIAISSMIYARYNKNQADFKLGEWNWGSWGGTINIFAWLYTFYMAIWLPFPTTLPVTASNMNYGGPLILFFLIVVVFAWTIRARKHWPGPNLTILDFIVATS